MYLEPPPIAPKNGAMFDVLWEGALGRVRAQSLLVDIDTAEVWDATTCQRISKPALEALQVVIRRELMILPTEVSRARAQAEKTGCSTLIDHRPKPTDFHPARLTQADGDEKSASYRYTITWGGCGYMITSPVRLDIRDGEVKFMIIGNSMYVIDDRGTTREVHYERVCVDSPPPPLAPKR